MSDDGKFNLSFPPSLPYPTKQPRRSIRLLVGNCFIKPLKSPQDWTNLSPWWLMFSGPGKHRSPHFRTPRASCAFWLQTTFRLWRSAYKYVALLCWAGHDSAALFERAPCMIDYQWLKSRTFGGDRLDVSLVCCAVFSQTPATRLSCPAYLPKTSLIFHPERDLQWINTKQTTGNTRTITAGSSASVWKRPSMLKRHQS